MHQDIIYHDTDYNFTITTQTELPSLTKSAQLERATTPYFWTNFLFTTHNLLGEGGPRKESTFDVKLCGAFDIYTVYLAGAPTCTV